MLRLLRNISSRDSDTLLAKAYRTADQLYNSGFKCWLSKIFLILKKYDIDISLTDGSNFNDYFKETVFSSYKNEWFSLAEKQPVLRTYIKFKKMFTGEEYLSLIRNFHLRRSLSKFRLSSHHLRIETGRYTKPKLPEVERICMLCNENCVEDEEHFLLHCKYYIEQRVKFFVGILHYEPNILSDDCKETFFNIMTSVNANIIFSLCKYIQICFKKRERMLLV